MMTSKDNDEISIKDLINIIKEYFNEFKRKWRMASLIIFAFSIMGFAYSYIKKPTYIATSTMMLENSKGGGISGALALASQFGLMSSGGGSAEIDEEKLMELITSEAIIKTALFKKSTINNKTDIFANHFIDLFGYKESWAKNEGDSLNGFRFKNSKDKLNLLETRVFKMFYNRLSKSSIESLKSKSGIISVSVKSPSEPFSKFFNQSLIESITDFYVKRITEKGQTNVNIIQKRVDSVAIALKDAEYALARWKDGNFQLVKAQGMMAEIDLRRNVEVNNSIYIEGIKQLEISKFTLLQDTPFLQVIDEPSFPIDAIGLSRTRGIIYGFVLGCILSISFIFARKRFMEIMREG